MKKRLLILLAAMTMVLSLVACGPKTLEEFYSDPEIITKMNAEMETLKMQTSDVFSDIGYEFDENHLTYWYKFASEVDPEMADGLKSDLDASLPQETLADMAADFETEIGISGVSISYIYYNVDGSVFHEISYGSAE